MVINLSQRSKYKNLLEALAILVRDNVYGPVDRLARAADVDMIRMAIYETLRYLSTEIRKGKIKLVLDEREVMEFLDEVERRGTGLAKRLATEALTLGLRMQLEQGQRETSK